MPTEEAKTITDAATPEATPENTVLHHNPFATRAPKVAGQSTRTAEEKFATSPATTPEGIARSERSRTAAPKGDK